MAAATMRPTTLPAPDFFFAAVSVATEPVGVGAERHGRLRLVLLGAACGRTECRRVGLTGRGLAGVRLRARVAVGRSLLRVGRVAGGRARGTHALRRLPCRGDGLRGCGRRCRGCGGDLLGVGGRCRDDLLRRLRRRRLGRRRGLGGGIFGALALCVAHLICSFCRPLITVALETVRFLCRGWVSTMRVA